MVQDQNQKWMEIWESWDKIYPERLSPGETPKETKFYPDYSDIIETPIQKRICNMITHGRGFLDYIDARVNPELAPKKYYSDGIPIDWNNLEKSNAAYRVRAEEHELGFPGIENLILIYAGIYDHREN